MTVQHRISTAALDEVFLNIRAVRQVLAPRGFWPEVEASLGRMIQEDRAFVTRQVLRNGARVTEAHPSPELLDLVGRFAEQALELLK